jgi:hypothetical protein
MGEAEAYLVLPPCFYLTNVQFNLGTQGGCASFAWLVFDDSWVRKVVPYAMVTQISGSLRRFRGRCDCDDDYRCVCVAATLTLVYKESVAGNHVSKTIKVSKGRFSSDMAFPAWLDQRSYADFEAWCGTCERSEKDEVAYFNNFQAENLRFDYFGNLIKFDFLRSPGAPTSLPQRFEPVEHKKKGFLRRKW